MNLLQETRVCHNLRLTWRACSASSATVWCFWASAFVCLETDTMPEIFCSRDVCDPPAFWPAAAGSCVAMLQVSAFVLTPKEALRVSPWHTNAQALSGQWPRGFDWSRFGPLALPWAACLSGTAQASRCATHAAKESPATRTPWWRRPLSV